ncbi:MAG: hypothetical protein PHT54_04665 [Candidatus Nanoarchaeia archaeon]|nr:hypothetical protein [Candidatus Nanoarchaeia archaeon]
MEDSYTGTQNIRANYSQMILDALGTSNGKEEVKNELSILLANWDEQAAESAADSLRDYLRVFNLTGSDVKAFLEVELDNLTKCNQIGSKDNLREIVLAYSQD